LPLIVFAYNNSIHSLQGPSIWDDFTHANNIARNETGDTACDHYNRFESDVALLKSLGFKHYRLSLSWPRMFPNGKVESENGKGVEFYNRLIDELVKNGITPYVTLYHWDLPSALQNEYSGMKGKVSCRAKRREERTMETRSGATRLDTRRFAPRSKA